jgi:hypothetical protein
MIVKQSTILRLSKALRREVFDVTKPELLWGALLAVAAFAFQFLIRHEFPKDLWSVVLPILWAGCCSLCILTIRAAISLRQEDLRDWVANVPIIIGAPSPTKPSLVPVSLMTFGICLLLCLLIIATYLFAPKGAPSLGVRREGAMVPSTASLPNVKSTAVHIGEQPLGLVRYDILPYEVGQKFRVHMFVDNKTAAPLRVVGYNAGVIIDNPPSDYQWREKFEEDLWTRMNSMEAAEDSRVRITVPVMKTGVFWILYENGNPLTQEDLDRLSRTAWVYVVARIRDARSNKILLESCFHTEPKSESLVFCASHNR